MGEWTLAAAALAYALGVLHGSWASREQTRRLTAERDRLRRWLDHERRGRDALWDRVVNLQDEVNRHG